METRTCIVETSRGAGVKFDFNHRLGRMEMNKVLPAGLVFPFDFGFITGTVGEDGDPLDAIIISELPSFPGCAIPCHIIGAIKSSQRENSGRPVRNDRYLAIPEISGQYAGIRELRELPRQIVKEIGQFFRSYNEQKGKRVTIKGYLNSRSALRQILRAEEDAEPMHLVQLLLPLYDRKGNSFPKRFFDSVKTKLSGMFGGLTLYLQSPAEGLWENDEDRMVKDTLVVYEVMVSRIDQDFWERYRTSLAKKFRQEKLLIRQSPVGLL